MEQEPNFIDDRFIVTLTVQELHKTFASLFKKEVVSLLAEKSKNNIPNSDEILLTRFEVAKIFKISTVSLDKWKKAKLLPEPVKIAGKVYYLKNEIMSLIKKHQKRSNGNY